MTPPKRPARHKPAARRRFVDACVISLRDSVERRKAFRANNPALEFEFVEAVDGRAISDDMLRHSGLFAPGLPYTRGAYGVAMTTYRLWTAIAAGDELMTIAEDDTIFRADFHDATLAYLRAHPDAHEFVAWGYNFDSILRGSIFNGRTPVTICFDEALLGKSVDAFRADRSPVLMMNCSSSTAFARTRSRRPAPASCSIAAFRCSRRSCSRMVWAANCRTTGLTSR